MSHRFVLIATLLCSCAMWDRSATTAEAGLTPGFYGPMLETVSCWGGRRAYYRAAFGPRRAFYRGYAMGSACCGTVPSGAMYGGFMPAPTNCCPGGACGTSFANYGEFASNTGCSSCSVGGANGSTLVPTPVPAPPPGSPYGPSSGAAPLPNAGGASAIPPGQFSPSNPPATYESGTGPTSSDLGSERATPEPRWNPKPPAATDSTPVKPATPSGSSTPKKKASPQSILPDDDGTSTGPLLQLDEKITWRPAVERRRLGMQPLQVEARLVRRPAYQKIDWLSIPIETELAKN